MGGNLENYQPTPAELEDTARLPALVEPAPLAEQQEEARDQLEGSLRALTENLRGLEESLRVKSHELSVYEREVGARDRQIAELQASLATSRQQHEQANGEIGDLQGALDQVRAQLSTVIAERDQHAAAHAGIESARAARELALTRATADAVQMQQRAERYLESLQSLEVQRQVYEGMVAERELQLQDVQSGAATRTANIELDLGAALDRERTLHSDLQFSRGQTAELDRQLREAQARHAAQLQELEAVRAEMRKQATQADAQQREAAENATRLERELRDHMDMIQALQQQHGAQLLKIEGVTGDLAAAEERIRDLQLELQQRDVRIERLNGVEADLRRQLAQAADQLAARDALIARLENEAESSAAVLDNIHQNLERLGSEPAAPAAAPAAAAEAIVRMLVPVNGDDRVVHLLGRKTTIGRTVDNDLRIDEHYISRHHAVILTSATSAIVEDLNSTNGVAINGKRVSRQVLSEGDLVTIGKAEFRFVVKPAS